MRNQKKIKKVIILTGPGYEEPEVLYPYYRFQEEGYQVEVVTSNNQQIAGKYGYPLKPTISSNQLDPKNYDAVIIPGGHEAPDRVRQVQELVDFVSAMYRRSKIVSSTCHGPWVLISAKIMRKKKATCYKGMKDDLINAGAHYQEKPVVVDGNLVTSDHPRNLAVWMRVTIDLLKAQ